jgi:uncharacterized protein (TIGR03435 family)
MSKFLTMLAFALTLLGSAVHAQNFPDLANRFARATITESGKPLLKGVIYKDTEDKLIVQGAPLSEVIARAYGVEPYRVVDGPEWIYADHLYDIEAVPPPAELLASDDALMLQSFLASRFKLEVRREVRNPPMLVLDIDFARQSELYAEVQQQLEEIKRREREAPGASGQVIDVAVLSTKTLTANIARRAGEPVIDLTGLSHVYFDGEPRLLYEIAPEALDFGASVALLKQSGVLVERRGVQHDVVVVTGIERPRLDVIDR